MGYDWIGYVVAAVMIITSAVSTYISYQNNKQTQDNAKFQRDSAAMHSWQQSQMETMNMIAEHRSYMAEMAFRGQQTANDAHTFNQEIAYKNALLEFEIEGQQAQLEFENLQQLADIEFAQRGVAAAFEAERTDLELLGQEWAEIAGANSVDQFERKRQQLKETAQIRVSQGESGIFGNTALKELANSQMQASWDAGIMSWNFSNKGKAQSSQIKKVKSTKDSRVNESLSGISRHIAGSMNGAYAGLTI